MIAPVYTTPPHFYQADVRQVSNQDINAAMPKKISIAAKPKKPQKKRIPSAPAPSRDPSPLPPPTGITPAPPPPPPPGAPGNQPPAPPTNNQSSSGPAAPQNYIGPAVSFGSSSQIGAVSRFGLGKNISVRPSVFLGNSPQFSLPITYDFALTNDDQFGDNPLIMLHAGGGISYQSVTGGNSLKPLAVLGADLNLGGGANLLLQLSSTFSSDFAGIAGIGLQF